MPMFLYSILEHLKNHQANGETARIRKKFKGVNQTLLNDKHDHSYLQQHLLKQIQNTSLMDNSMMIPLATHSRL